MKSNHFCVYHGSDSLNIKVRAIMEKLLISKLFIKYSWSGRSLVTSAKEKEIFAEKNGIQYQGSALERKDIEDAIKDVLRRGNLRFKRVDHV